MGCLLHTEVGSQPGSTRGWLRATLLPGTSLLGATLSHSLMEGAPILIPISTKTLGVLYKYFILFQQRVPTAQCLCTDTSFPVRAGLSGPGGSEPERTATTTLGPWL